MQTQSSRVQHLQQQEMSKEVCEMFVQQLDMIPQMLATQPMRDTFETKLRRRLANVRQRKSPATAGQESHQIKTTFAIADDEDDYEDKHGDSMSHRRRFVSSVHRSSYDIITNQASTIQAVVEPRHARRRTRHIIKASEEEQQEIQKRIQAEENAAAAAVVLKPSLPKTPKAPTAVGPAEDYIDDDSTGANVDLMKKPSSASRVNFKTQAPAGPPPPPLVPPQTTLIKLLPEPSYAKTLDNEALSDQINILKHDVRAVETDIDRLMRRPELLSFTALDHDNCVIGSSSTANAQFGNEQQQQEEQQIVSKLHELAKFTREATEHCLDQLAPTAGPLLVEVQLTNGMSLCLQTEPQQPRNTFLMSLLRSAAQVDAQQVNAATEAEAVPYQIDYPFYDMFSNTKSYSDEESAVRTTLRESFSKYQQTQAVALQQKRKSNFRLNEEGEIVKPSAEKAVVQSTTSAAVTTGRGRPKAAANGDTNSPTKEVVKTTKSAFDGMTITSADDKKREAAIQAQRVALDRVIYIVNETRLLSEITDEIERTTDPVRIEEEKARNSLTLKPGVFAGELGSSIEEKFSQPGTLATAVNRGSRTSVVSTSSAGIGKTTSSSSVLSTNQKGRPK